MATFIESIDGGKRLNVEHTRGEPLSITLVFTDPSAITVVTNRTWTGHVRATVDGEMLAEFEKTSEETTTLPGGVAARLVVLTSTDVADLDEGDYVFDLRRESGPSSPNTYVPRSSLTISVAATQESGS